MHEAKALNQRETVVRAEPWVLNYSLYSDTVHFSKFSKDISSKLDHQVS